MTHKQLVFVSEYLMYGNATAAYKLAFGIQDDNVAAAGASRLLRNVKIQAYLKQFKDSIMEKAEITLERTIQEIARVAFANIADVLKGKKISDLPEDVQAAISEVTVTESKYGKRRTIKMHSKIQALDMLMKHFGAYKSLKDIIDGLTEEQSEQIFNQLLEKLQSNE
ncbi:terminase small subunit [Cytophagaceae bacterium YF14B1]|uniref:Terminase small subunit n=1 Tax=Xanthocytophaga flava TaxID=3048013 RepID=A0AAE3QQQ1_9BACT|nr:terminase small subunit [Xanthocytophaga flavus]MDJ1481745.1 terminase small subunit [Xanthocytophaga flavus]